MTFWSQVLLFARRDLTIEGRSGEVVGVVMPFAAVAVLVVPLTATATSSLRALGPPVFWLILLVFGMQVAMRNTGLESPSQRRHLALAGADPVARFTGRSIAMTVLVWAVAAVTLPLMHLLYSPEASPLWATLAALVAFAPGLAMLTTLIGDISAGLRMRSALVPMVTAPLTVPLLVAGSQMVVSIAEGEGSLTWLLLLILTDLSLAITGVLAASAIEDTTL